MVKSAKDRTITVTRIMDLPDKINVPLSAYTTIEVELAEHSPFKCNLDDFLNDSI